METWHFHLMSDQLAALLAKAPLGWCRPTYVHIAATLVLRDGCARDGSLNLNLFASFGFSWMAIHFVELAIVCTPQHASTCVCSYSYSCRRRSVLIWDSCSLTSVRSSYKSIVQSSARRLSSPIIWTVDVMTVRGLPCSPAAEFLWNVSSCVDCVGILRIIGTLKWSRFERWWREKANRRGLRLRQQTEARAHVQLLRRQVNWLSRRFKSSCRKQSSRAIMILREKITKKAHWLTLSNLVKFRSS